MLKIKPQFWTKNGRERFVVLSMEDFEKVQEMIEDEGLSRILREAKRKEANAPTISHEEMMRRLGMKPPRKRKATKPSLGSKRRRLEGKQRQSEKKQNRRPPME